MANTIKIKRGLSTDLNNASLQQGELAMTTDTYNLYVGVGSGNYIKIGGGPKNISDGKAIGSARTIGAKDSEGQPLGEYAWAEGKDTIASGNKSHAEGDNTNASGESSHAEGYHTKALGYYSHAEGAYTEVSGSYSHAEGYQIKASGHFQHVQGKYNIEDTTSAHIVGNGSISVRSNAHTLDWSGNAWFAGDVYTGSTSGTNKDEGSVKLAKITEVPTKTSQLTNDSQFVTSTDILSNLVDGKAEGSIRSINAYDETEALLGKYAQAFGYHTEASGNGSHAEGTNTRASSSDSHAEGNGTTASGYWSHAEGRFTTASGEYSHAEGYNTIVSGHASHAEGDYTIAKGKNQHVQGKYNIEDTISAHIVGNGTEYNARSNAHTLDWSGNAWFAGDVYVKSTGGKNKDSGSKKLATEEYVNNLVGDIETILTTLTTGSGV